MAQVKIYGIREHLLSVRDRLSETIHECVMDVLGMPEDKRAHRFFPMDRGDMLCPGGRTDAYTIIEINLIEGRSETTRKKLVRRLFECVADRVGISNQDLEICIQETPACNWGFRGLHGDEAQLNYQINV